MKPSTISLCSLGLLTAAALPANLASSTPAPTRASDPEEPQGAPRAVILGDYDADGLSDIYAVNPYGEDRLYRNAGDGSFVDATTETGLSGLTGTHQVLFADYDGDGLSDLLVVSARGMRLFRNIGETFVDDTVRSGLNLSTVSPEAKWEDIEGDGVLDLVLRSREGVQLYRGLGDGTFEQLNVTVSGTAPMQSTAGDVDGGEEPGFPGAPGAPGRAPARVPGARPAVDTGPAGPGGGSSAATAGVTWSGTGAGPNMAAGSVLACAGSIEDQANPGTGSCIPASTTATDGMLFPLGEDFFVDDNTGQVGMGTLDPRMSLHIVGDSPSLGSLLVAPAESVNNSNSELWLAEDDDGTYRMGLRYDGAENELPVVGSNDGTELGPWMTITREEGDVAFSGVLDVAEIEPAGGELDVSGRLTVSNDSGRELIVGSNLEIYTGGYDAGVPTSQNSIRAGSNNLTLNSSDNGDLLINFDTGEDLKVYARTFVRHATLPGEQASTQTAMVIQQGGTGSYLICQDANATSTNLFEITDTGRVVTTAVEITGGGDLVEGFESSEGRLEPGTVVVIDTKNPGQLRVSSAPYDRKVAGVVSGAGGIAHGIRMGQDGVMDGDNLVAMTGRVYVKCTAENGAINAGDLLTTAGVRGHAMRVDDPNLGFGSVIGKAMTSLEDGEGLVLVLVNLQ